jgi:hypothetical protein
MTESERMIWAAAFAVGYQYEWEKEFNIGDIIDINSVLMGCAAAVHEFRRNLPDAEKEFCHSGLDGEDVIGMYREMLGSAQFHKSEV